MNSILFTVNVLIVCFTTSQASNGWPKHDISTLKLLQIVHKHGERAPPASQFTPNDPYKDAKYWPEGLGELTSKGKYRMYKTGQYIRQEYGPYLGDKYSPREVYARSAASDRCYESASTLLSGAYPPKQDVWKWSNGSDPELGHIWQPIKIETFIPEKEDLVCNLAKHCKLVNKETDRIYNQSVVHEFVDKNSDLYKNVSKVVGLDVRGIWEAFDVYDALSVELDNNYYWNKSWTHEEEEAIVGQLYHSEIMGYRSDYGSAIIRRLRAGGLVQELNRNFKSVMDNKNTKKLYVYSTYGAHVVALMQALAIWDEDIPPFGSALLFELHQKKDSQYFVRVFYRKERDINTGIPHSIALTDCQKLNDCPIDRYMNSTKHLIYGDFDKECEN